MRDHSITAFLADLAARIPAPGGGASAALHAAQSAALLSMVARYSDGEKFAPHSGEIGRILAEADDLRSVALGLMEEDAAAFTAVTQAYQLPRASDSDKAARKAAIAQALIGAATPPATLIEVAGRLITLAEELLPIGNRNVITDVAAAADAARAAASTAQVNVEINLNGITDEQARAEFTARAQQVPSLAARAEQVTATVRKEISK